MPGNCARNSPAVLKHLAIMRATKARWQVAEVRKAAAVAQAEESALEARIHDDVWLAAKEGSAECVRRFVETRAFDVFAHHDGSVAQVLDGERVVSHGGGMTVLHYAAWGGHLELARYLLALVAKGLGAEKCRVLCNQVDSAASGCTPLVLACRSAQGHFGDRLALVRLLVENGAEAAAQDVRGDTCLHHAVRARALPVVRYLVRGANNTIMACVTRNFKGARPGELADAMMAARPSASTVGIAKLLRGAEAGGDLRRKIECTKRRGERAAKSAAQREVEEADRVLETAGEMARRAALLCGQQYAKAEAVRLQDEARVVGKAGAGARLQMEQWLGTADGQAKLELETYDIKTDMKLERKAKGLRMLRFRGVDAEAQKRARAGLFLAAEVQKGGEAKRGFRAQRPPIKFVSVQMR